MIFKQNLKAKFPNASESFLKLNSKEENSNNNSRKVAKLESNLSYEPLAEEKLQRDVQERYIVRIESVRKHMLDTDNICSKYITDLLRYSYIISSDDFEQTTIQTTERKCMPEEQEHTKIEIEVYETNK